MKMGKRNFWLVLVSALFITILQSVHTLDYNSAKEGLPCFEPRTVKSDDNWLNSVRNWYFVGMSRLDLYTLSADVTGKNPKDLREDEIYYDSCLSWNSSADMTFDVFGFNRHTKRYKLEPLDEYFEKMKFSALVGELHGTAYTILTDNKTFSLTVSCFENLKEMVWTVESPYKSLPMETMNLAHEHVASLGFKREYFTGQRYDHCKDDGEGEIGKLVSKGYSFFT